MIIKVCVVSPGEETFICGGEGDFTVQRLSDIEKALQEDFSGTPIDAHGIYTIEPQWTPEQVGECGGVPRVELAGYWYFVTLAYEPFPPGGPEE